ncbi:MAG TPA: DUF2254 domain-containing protein [Adhaeribacter sp.]|nr:DUF2254 domain-containing protein [Adhaeribacter sp.]
MKLNGFGFLNRKMAAWYNGITSSIAFYPVLITLLYLLLVTGMLWFDYSSLAKELSEEMPWLKFKEMEAVRAILTTLIAGIISLMALSFSMVMVVLNQATSAVSPKVMQGLITRKEHQFVLGNQFGAILYFMVVLLLLRGVEFYKIPIFSVSLGLLLAFWSLGLFVYFIHSISKSIQVTNIILRIYKSTSAVLDELRDEGPQFVAATKATFNTPYKYITDKPGYLQEINVKGLLKLAGKHNLVLALEPRFTDFIPTGSTLFRASVPPETLPEKDLKLLYSNILFFNSEDIETNYVYGFTQLSEIAVKSLSPGINDPGIAVICLQVLTDLFVKLYPIKVQEVFADEAGTARIKVKHISGERLLSQVLSPIRHYGKEDLSVVRALLILLWHLGCADQEERRLRELLNQQATGALTSIRSSLQLPADAQFLNDIIANMQEMEPPYFRISKLEV